MSTPPRDEEWQALLARARGLEPALYPEPVPSVDLGGLSNEALLHALASDDVSERAAAATLLGEREASAALTRLHVLSQGDPEESVRQAAALALLKLGGEVTLAEVAKNLRDEDPETVARAAITLGRLGDPRVVPNLLEAFQTEVSEVGAAVAWALGRLRDPRAIEWLAASLENGFVSPNAAEALGEIATPAVVTPLLGALRHPNAEARAYAARGLGAVKPPTNLSGVRAQRWFQVREELVEGLRDVLDQEGQPAKVRFAAAVSLYQQGDKSAAKRMMQVLSDE